MLKLNDKSPMPYGKYEGVKMANLPANYLLYLYDEDMCGAPVRLYVKEREEDLRDE